MKNTCDLKWKFIVTAVSEIEQNRSIHVSCDTKTGNYDTAIYANKTMKLTQSCDNRKRGLTKI